MRTSELLVVVAAMGATCLVSTRLQAASAAPREIEAEKFVVKDQTGAVKATLGIGKDGGGEVQLFGLDTKAPVLTISVAEDGSSQIRMLAPNGKESMAFRVSEKVGAELVLLEREKDIGFLASCRGGYPSFTIAGDGGKPRMILSSSAERTAIEMMDAKGTMRVGLMTEAAGDASLVVLGKDSMFSIPEKK